MKRVENNKWLDNTLSDALGSEKSEANFEKWRQSHGDAVEMLTSQAGRQPSARARARPFSVRSVIMRSKIAKLAAAAVLVIAALIGVRIFSGSDEQPTGESANLRELAGEGGLRSEDGLNEVDTPVELASELERVEQMYAANDAGGLVAMLSEGRFESKVAAANYLAKMNVGAEALDALEEANTAHGGDSPDNPFTPAVVEIRNRVKAGEGPSGPGTLVAKGDVLLGAETRSGLRPLAGQHEEKNTSVTRRRISRPRGTGFASSVVAESAEVVIDGRPVRGGGHSIWQVMPGNLSQNLVLYYSFYNTADADTVADISGKGYHGQVHEAEYVSDEVLGGAMHFNGEDAYVRTPDMHLEAFTFSAWVKTEVRGINNRRIFQADDGDNYYTVEGNTHGGISVYVAKDVAIDEYNWRLPRGIWTHITVTYDGSTLNIYKNSRLTESGRHNLTKGIEGPAYIGGIGSYNGGFWQGMIDEVALFNRALTEEEVGQLYLLTGEVLEVPEVVEEPEMDEDEESEHFEEVVADGYPVRAGGGSIAQVVPASTYGNVALYYSFYSNADPATVVDISGGNFHGKVHGAQYITDETLGGAMSFDGQNDYISIGDISLSEFTFSAWVKTTTDGLNNRRIFQLDDGENYYTVEGNTHGGISVYVAKDIAIDEYNWRLARGIWTHITVTYDGSTLNIYKNGRLTESGRHNLTKGIEGQAYIGGIGSYNGGFWRGMIDEVALFSRALTEEEVQQLYSMTGEVVEPSETTR